MSRLFGSWRGLRWLAFLFSLALDGYIFHISDPFTPRSFMTSGIGAALLFLLFLEVARAMKGRARIRQALDDHERITYQVGRHVLALLRNIAKHPLAYNAIWFPVWIAIFATAAPTVEFVSNSSGVISAVLTISCYLAYLYTTYMCR